MLDKKQEILDIFKIDISEKSKEFKHRYLRLCFYLEFKEKGNVAIREVLNVNRTDINRYQGQIDRIMSTDLFITTKKAYDTNDHRLLDYAFSKEFKLDVEPHRGNQPTEAIRIPYSVMEVIDIMKPFGDFENPLWDKLLKDYTLEDWAEIETLKNC